MYKKKPAYFKNPQFDSSSKYYPGNKIGVLLIHGFTATPVEVNLLAVYLHHIGYSVSCPLLPGHGTVIEDLHRATWEDWANHVEKAYLDLSSACEEVFVGGESLGSLLTMNLAVNHPEVSGLMINAPALYARTKLVYTSPFMQFFVKQKEKKRTAIKNLVDDRWQGYDIYSVPAAAQVLYFQHKIRRSLADIKQPVIIFQGKLDQSIQPHGAQVVFNQISSTDKELIWLDYSTHCVLLDQEWENIAEKSAAFIERQL